MNAVELSLQKPSANPREARADQYFERDLKGQRDWFSKHASAYKQRSQSLAFLVIAAGSITTFVQVFGQAPWVSIITAGLGALVVFAEGWQRIARYSETWVGYRNASERMKRERRLFLNGAGSYRNLGDDEAYLQFVENIEAIIGEEQQTFWKDRRSEAPAQTPRSPLVTAGKE
ncbi:DUF4231 domain-containing protein [Microvirga arabica]|uniref:DUF4231 domain-containing protein n=1 Tax=Microvirga arabica TaxID=1128671 RepID=A0ABV6Y6R7_9HYPH